MRLLYSLISYWYDCPTKPVLIYQEQAFVLYSAVWNVYSAMVNVRSAMVNVRSALRNIKPIRYRDKIQMAIMKTYIQQALYFYYY